MIFKFSIKKLFYLIGKYFSKEITLKYKKQLKTYFAVKIKIKISNIQYLIIVISLVFLENVNIFLNSKYPTFIEIFHEHYLCYACFKLLPF